MNDFGRKVEEASSRVNKTISEVAERLEKESTEVIQYLNDEVVPAVRSHSARTEGSAVRAAPAHTERPATTPDAPAAHATLTCASNVASSTPPDNSTHGTPDASASSAHASTHRPRSVTEGS